MAYSSETMKKEYEKETKTQRMKNLKKLREEIAQLSLTDFHNKTGFTKNDISLLENGDKFLSLFHIQAYKKYFLENHNINISADYLLGYTDIIENNNSNFQNRIGLSNDAMEMLAYWKEKQEESQLIEPYLRINIDTLNAILEDHFQRVKDLSPLHVGQSLLFYVGLYLEPHKIKQLADDLVRINSGTHWENVEIGDVLEKKCGTRYTIDNMSVVNNDTLLKSDNYLITVINESNNTRYSIDINSLFKSYLKDEIMEKLDQLKVRHQRRR